MNYETIIEIYLSTPSQTSCAYG
uniref:Uncharacterized protein LOC105136315 isoform X2 n=1 Tax=Rhizophora mucronata TaxID=61149 RepID=A0A2P2KYQ2_RHIMU